MATNSFYCNKCKKYTIHYELSWSEFQASTGDDEFGNQIITRFCDITGISKVSKTLTGDRFWKCGECGDTMIRNSAGDEV